MLPEQLGKLRKSLIDKGYNARTVDEDRLLEELDAFNNSRLITESFEKGELREAFKSYGGGIVCRHCGNVL